MIVCGIDPGVSDAVGMCWVEDGRIIDSAQIPSESGVTKLPRIEQVCFIAERAALVMNEIDARDTDVVAIEDWEVMGSMSTRAGTNTPMLIGSLAALLSPDERRRMHVISPSRVRREHDWAKSKSWKQVVAALFGDDAVSLLKNDHLRCAAGVALCAGADIRFGAGLLAGVR